MKSDKYVNEKLNITTLTPLQIGGDQASNLSPVTDFIVKGDIALIINQDKLESLLSEDMEILDEYVRSVKDGSFDLENFINNKLDADIEELTSSKIKIEGYLGKNEVKSFINSVGKPFIPGSTIKGSIRTAVVYDYIMNDKVQITKQILTEAKRRYPKVFELYEIQKKRRLDRKEYAELKNLRNFNQFYNELRLFKPREKKKDKTGNEYFIDWGHDFRHIQISDSQLLEADNTRITPLFRYYLTKDDTKTEPWAQVLKEKTTTEFNFKIEKNFKDPFLQTINSNTYKEIFRMINKFSIDVLEFELEMFNEFTKNGKGDKQKIEENLKGIISYYIDLKEKIKFSRDNYAVIRIGGGKTYFDNSIGLALYKADKEKFKQFRKILGFWKHRSNGQFVEEDSPITRTFYFDEDIDKYLPIGWTVIYFEKDKNDVKKIFELDNKDNRKITTQKEMKTNKNDDEEIDFSKLENLGRVVKKRDK